MIFQTSHIIWNLLNFLILIGFLYWVAGKPVGNMIRGKQESVSTTISDVEERLAEVNKKLDQQSKQLEDVKKDIEKIETQAAEMAKKLREEIIEAANNEAQKVREQMKKSMEQDLNRAKADLRAEVVDQALIKAQDLINQKLDKSTHLKMVEDFALSLNVNSNN